MKRTYLNFNVFQFLLLSLFLCNPLFAQHQNWQKVLTIEAVWKHYPDKIHSLISAIDLERSELSTVKRIVTSGDSLSAVKALLEHYRKSEYGRWLAFEPVDMNHEAVSKVAFQLLGDTVTIHEQTAKVPPSKSGGWNWHFTGPEGDDEFGYNLNRHRYLLSFLELYQESHQEKYAKKFDSIIRDWAIHNPLPPRSDSIYLVLASNTLDWRDIGEVVWRDLEAGNRLEACWPQLFYGFQDSDAFSDAGRIFMLCSLVEQAEYLLKYHKRGHNWTTMEMNGLGLVALTFPEFKGASHWADYAMGVMEQEINRQVYPDGVQTELSSKTQWVALKPFETIAANFEKAGKKVKPEYMERVIKMYDYLAYSMRPDGHQPLNNDSDREDLRPRVLKAAQKFNRPDWTWIATNGSSGVAPKGLPTSVFPWAGLHIMRNGWDKNAHWTLFDTGPFGTGHQHADMLHLSIAAFGKDLLVDGGRFTHQDYFSFDPTIWRGYFRSSFSHNVLLVDGQGQKNGKLRASKALVEGEDFVNTPVYDFARGTFLDGYVGVEGAVSHTRTVVYVRSLFWVVVDYVTTDKPRKIQALWHFAPSCEVKTDVARSYTDNQADGNIEIVPVANLDWEVELIKGQEKPFIQGWYSEDYGKKEPNIAAVYTSNIAKATTFAWVMIPSIGKRVKVAATVLKQDAEHIQLKVQLERKNPVIVNVPLTKGLPTVNHH